MTKKKLTEKDLPTTRRRLFFDIETSPNIGMFWEAGFKKRIDYDNILEERKIICICWKFEDEKQVSALTWDSKQNDKKMLIDFIKVLNTADEVVGHNGDRFDLPWLRTRCLFHRIEMFPFYQTIDTLKTSRARFKFNSNRLNYIANYLGFGGKIKTEFKLWKDIVLHKNQKALESMVKYCKKDVALLEKVYKEMRVHMPVKTHFGVIYGQDKRTCPECGSSDVVLSKHVVTATGVKKVQRQCKSCGKYHTILNK